jgi:predicted nucleotide-binding protein (sugar kinase/HSP70/actin superfamily)
MGRTVVPYSLVIEQVMHRFDNYRRTLRREDREAFDDLMRTAKMQVQAGVMAQHPNAFDSMSMAMLVQLKREINELKKNIKTEGELYGEVETK